MDDRSSNLKLFGRPLVVAEDFFNIVRFEKLAARSIHLTQISHSNAKNTGLVG